MHIFFRMEDGSYIAFFELPEAEPTGRDERTQEWVHHLALNVADEATLHAAKERFEQHGIKVRGTQ